jgi:hypothetical protein
MQKVFTVLALSLLVHVVQLSSALPALAAERFNDLQCQVDFVEKDICNVSFFRRFISAKLVKSGAAHRFQLKNLVRWSYENSSLRKRASLLTTRVEHIHIFTLVFRDPVVGGYTTLVIDFDDIANVPPMKALLTDIAPEG